MSTIKHKQYNLLKVPNNYKLSFLNQCYNQMLTAAINADCFTVINNCSCNHVTCLHLSTTLHLAGYSK